MPQGRLLLQERLLLQMPQQQILLQSLLLSLGATDASREASTTEASTEDSSLATTFQGPDDYTFLAPN